MSSTIPHLSTKWPQLLGSAHLSCILSSAFVNHWLLLQLQLMTLWCVRREVLQCRLSPGLMVHASISIDFYVEQGETLICEMRWCSPAGWREGVSLTSHSGNIDCLCSCCLRRAAERRGCLAAGSADKDNSRWLMTVKGLIKCSNNTLVDCCC